MTNLYQQVANLNPKYLIEVTQKGEIYTDSLKVAAAFGRLHKDVLRAISNLDCSEGFTSAHFCAHVEFVQAGAVKRKSKVFKMTKNGFMFLVMGFTGKKAAQVKEAYISAFDQMYIELYGEPAQRMPRPIEFRGHKVLQLKQIDQLHGRLPNHSQTRFYEKKDQMQEGFDYFRVKPEDKQLLLDQGFHQYRRNMILITSNGYKKLTKTYTEPNSRETRKRVLEGYYIQASEYQFKESDKANAEAYQALDLLRRWGRIRETQQGTERATCLIQWGLLVEQFLNGKPLADAHPSDDMIVRIATWNRVAHYRYRQLEELSKQLSVLTSRIDDVKDNLYDPITEPLLGMLEFADAANVKKLIESQDRRRSRAGA